MFKLDTYLNFNGQTEEAFTFYRGVFKSDFRMLMRFREMPGSEKMPEADKEKIFHVSLPIGENILMGTDILETQNQKLNVGDNFSLHITVKSEEEGRRIFNALSVSGQVVMPLSKEAWSELFGICTDKYGIQWMINVGN